MGNSYKICWPSQEEVCTYRSQVLHYSKLALAPEHFAVIAISQQGQTPAPRQTVQTSPLHLPGVSLGRSAQSLGENWEMLLVAPRAHHKFSRISVLSHLGQSCWWLSSPTTAGTLQEQLMYSEGWNPHLRHPNYLVRLGNKETGCSRELLLGLKSSQKRSFSSKRKEESKDSIMKLFHRIR